MFVNSSRLSGVVSLRGVTTTPFVALAPCVSGESILGPTDVVDRSKPPVWHQVEYVSEVLDNSALPIELFGMVKSDAALGLFGFAIKSDATCGLLMYVIESDATFGLFVFVMKSGAAYGLFMCPVSSVECST